MYDHDKFRNYLHTAAIVFILLGSVFDFAMIFFADRVKNIAQDDQEEEEEEEKKKKEEKLIELGKIEEKP